MVPLVGERLVEEDIPRLVGLEVWLLNLLPEYLLQLDLVAQSIQWG